MSSPKNQKHAEGAVILAGAMAFIVATVDSVLAAVATFASVFVIYYVSLIIHEGGHYVTSLFFRAQPQIKSFSIVSTPTKRAHTLLISLAGPIAGAVLPLAVVLMSAEVPVPIGITFGAFVLAVNHLVMLLPIFPDGMLIKNLITRKVIS